VSDAEDSFSESAGAPPPDVNDPTDVDLNAKMVDERKREWQEDLGQVLHSPAARRVLWAIIDRSGMSARESQVDHHARMAYNAGARDLALWLIEELTQVDAAAYPSLLVEARKQRETEQALHEARRIDAHRHQGGPDARKLSS
jgi:hypothetical protein